VAFTAIFFWLFHISEERNRAKAAAAREHREKLNLRLSPELSAVLPAIKQANRTLVAIRDPQNMYPLLRALEDEGPGTDLIVLHSKRAQGLQLGGDNSSLGPDEELLFSNVIAVAEKAGKTVIPVMVTSNDPSYAIAQTAQVLGATEIVMGVSHLGPEAQVERLAMTFGALGTGGAAPVKITFYRPTGYRMQIEI
jgi:nucleotide-binding universal stress UspA family protein